MPRLHTTLLLAVLLAAVAIVRPAPALAAVPCEAQPERTADSPRSTLPTTSNLSVEEVLTGENAPIAATPVATPAATPVSIDDSRAQGPTENIVRCLLYNDVAAFATLLTPEFRAQRLGILNADQAPTVMADVGTIRLLSIGTTVATQDRPQADAELLLDGERLLVVTLTYALIDGYAYLDDSVVTRAANINNPVEVLLDDEAVDPSSLEVRAPAVTRLTIDHAGDVPVGYTLTDGDGNVLREGRVDPDTYAGPPDDSVFVLYDLEPGDYTLTITPRGNPLAETQTVVITVTP